MGDLINYKNLSEQVYVIIKNMIIDHEINPGERVTEERLAQEIGVSRTTIKRAIVLLLMDGLLEEKPRLKGIYVKENSLDDILAIYDIRALLEGLAVRYAAKIISDDKIKEMERIFTNFENLNKNKKQGEIVKLELKFHDLLIKASNNDILIHTCRHFLPQIAKFKLGIIRPPSEVLKEHLKIIDALRSHDAELAEELVIQHINKTRKKIKNKNRIIEKESKI